VEKGRTRTGKEFGKKSSWYKRGGNEVVIFVPATPNLQLQKKYRKEVKREGFKIKVVEKAGIAIKRLLQKSDLFILRQCEREERKGPCNRESVICEIKGAFFWEDPDQDF